MVAELPGGKLMLNMRNYDRSKKARQVAISANGGEAMPASSARITARSLTRYAPRASSKSTISTP